MKHKANEDKTSQTKEKPSEQPVFVPQVIEIGGRFESRFVRPGRRRIVDQVVLNPQLVPSCIIERTQITWVHATPDRTNQSDRGREEAS
jgi:hypothetical protein